VNRDGVGQPQRDLQAVGEPPACHFVPEQGREHDHIPAVVKMHDWQPVLVQLCELLQAGQPDFEEVYVRRQRLPVGSRGFTTRRGARRIRTTAVLHGELLNLNLDFLLRRPSGNHLC
jgi:hypothetical protein